MAPSARVPNASALEAASAERGGALARTDPGGRVASRVVDVCWVWGRSGCVFFLWSYLFWEFPEAKRFARVRFSSSEGNRDVDFL